MSQQHSIQIQRLEREVKALTERVKALEALVHEMNVSDKRRENMRKARIAKFMNQGHSEEEARRLAG